MEFRYTSGSGEDVVTSLEAARADLVVRGLPVRRFGSYAGMGHYPGWWWAATMGDLVGYESLLERDRLMLADFDQDVVAVASQPFGLAGRDGDAVRRHVPDYMLLRRDGSVEVVDVKPARLVDKPEVAEVLDWTGRELAQRRWRYTVWSGTNPQRLTNVRFLSQGRRAHLVDVDALAALKSHGEVGICLASALRATASDTDFGSATLRAAMVSLLWQQDWSVPLDEPIDGDTRITEVREDDDDQSSA